MRPLCREQCSGHGPLEAEITDCQPPAGQPGWEPPSSLYVHIPFCPYKCPYCDFVTHVGSPSLIAPYVDSVCEEISRSGGSVAAARLKTVYFGGGTPGMLAPHQIQQILATAGSTFGIEESAEIDLETNPDTVSYDSLAGFRTVGVNRLSLGVQSMDEAELARLGRGHSPETVVASMKIARKAGFDNVSLDLIYGTPGQSMASWLETLASVLALEPDHLSLYALIVEPGTTFNLMQRRGRLFLPEDDLVAEMYFEARRLLTAAGFVHYEVANWARPGLESRHNLTYWRNRQFLAAGVGAFDYLRPYRSVRIRGVKPYIDALRSGASVIREHEESSPEIERFETAVMGLRLLNEGLNRQAFDRRFPEGLDAAYGRVIIDLTAHGFLVDDGQRVRLPEDKVPVANEIWERFLPSG